MPKIQNLKFLKTMNKPAFPTPHIPGRDVVDDIPAREGMSLREWYAGLAMQGLISNSVWLTKTVSNRPGSEDPEIVDHIIAKTALAIADALIYETQK